MLTLIYKVTAKKMTHTTVRACCERYPSGSGVKAETREPAGEAVGRGVCLPQCFALRSGLVNSAFLQVGTGPVWG